MHTGLHNEMALLAVPLTYTASVNADFPLQIWQMPKPLPWLPSLLHCHGLDIPNLHDGSNLHLANPDERKEEGEGKGEGEGEEEEEEEGSKVAQDKAGESGQDTAEEVVVVVAVGPTDSVEVEEGRESERCGIGIGRKTTSL